MSPTTNTSGWPGQREVGVDADPAGAVERGAGLLGRACWPSGLACTPAAQILVTAVDPLGAAVLVLHLDAALVDVGDHRAEQHLDAELLELGLGLRAELGAERRQHLRRGVDAGRPGRCGC